MYKVPLLYTTYCTDTNYSQFTYIYIVCCCFVFFSFCVIIKMTISIFCERSMENEWMNEYGIPQLTESCPRNLWQIEWFCFYAIKQSLSSLIALGYGRWQCLSIKLQLRMFTTVLTQARLRIETVPIFWSQFVVTTYIISGMNFITVHPVMQTYYLLLWFCFGSNISVIKPMLSLWNTSWCFGGAEW
jgi:hypothetical protein